MSKTLYATQSNSVADAGFVEGGFYDNIARKILEAMPTFDWTTPIHFWEKLFTLPIDQFLILKFLPRHAQVSHNNSFLSCVAREGGSI